MPDIFWTGKMSLPLKIMVNMGFALAWVTGNERNSTAMRENRMTS
jgi:hypothetical protein